MIRKRNTHLLLFSFIISALFLLICSKCSPLYAFNDWVDVHCFFTVGKSILEGMVPYRDIYEQKGPILYFLFSAAAFLSRNSFLGVYLLETVSIALFLYFSGKIAQLYLGNSRSTWIIVLLLAPMVTLSTAFLYGGGAEEICLWTLAFSLYNINLAIHEGRMLTVREAFCIGLCAGFNLYIKFTLLGFFLGLAVFVLVWYLIFEKKAALLPAVIFAFLGGIAAVSLPIFLYFLIHGAVDDFFTVYFYNNLFLYQGDIGIYSNRVHFFIACLWASFHKNMEFMIPAVIGGLWLLFTPKQNKKLFTAVALSVCFLSLAVFGGGRIYEYYPMPFAVFGVYGLIAPALWIRRVLLKDALFGKQICFVFPICLGLLTALLLGSSYFLSDNTYLLSYGPEDMAQMHFAEYMSQKEDPTLLNFDFLDGGFYYAADIVPNCKYFCGLNIDLPEIRAVQNQYIEQGLVDFVVTRSLKLEELGVDGSLYRLADEFEMLFEKKNTTFYLYEHIS